VGFDSQGAFAWSKKTGVILFGYGQAMGINEKNQVVGGAGRATLWELSDSTFTMHDLGALGGDYGMAYDINEDGWVVGDSRTRTGQIHAFLWTPRKGMLDLGTLGGSDSLARAINDKGWVVGLSQIPSGEWHAFLWKPGSKMRDLGTLGGSESRAWDVNNLGQVTGWSIALNPINSHAFLWSEATGMVDLGPLEPSLPSYGYAINDSSWIAGVVQLPGGFGVFRWTPDTGLVEVGGYGDSGDQIMVEAMNERGDIIGWLVFNGPRPLLWRYTP
jgi:probable HAF family extracellular repeat protein